MRSILLTHLVQILALFVFIGCTPGEGSHADGDNDKTAVENEKTSTYNPAVLDSVQRHTENGETAMQLKRRLRGVWTGGSSENASFEISDSAILYTEHQQVFPYSVQGDTIRIQYPGYRAAFHIRFEGDSLLMHDKGSGKTKFWRFKD